MSIYIYIYIYNISLATDQHLAISFSTLLNAVFMTQDLHQNYDDYILYTLCQFSLVQKDIDIIIIILKLQLFVRV